MAPLTRPQRSKRSQGAAMDGRGTVLLLCLLIVALTLPVLSFPYLWDDFDFLERSRNLTAGELLPDPQTLYYRPISREMYFALLIALGGHPMVGHVLNGLVLLIAAYLVFAIGREWRGRMGGFVAAVVLASMGAIPILVGWISGIQDLLAMAFVLGALLAELRGRGGVAPWLFLGGLLSKESAAAMLPAILFAGRLPGGARRFGPRLAVYAGVVLAWAALHPATRVLFTSRGRIVSSDTAGAWSAPRLENIWSGARAAFNIPLGPPDGNGLLPFLPALLGVLALILLAWHLLSRGHTASEVQEHEPNRLLLLAGLSFFPPLILTLFLRHWSPYYACMPTVGVALAAGSLVPRIRFAWAALLCLCYAGMGLVSRMADLPPTITSERNLAATAEALTAVERGFKSLHDSFPKGSRIYTSVQIEGHGGLHHQMYRFQPLRVWYRDPTLFVLDPNRYRPGGTAEFLFWISPTLDIGEINVGTMEARTSGPLPDVLQYHKTLRTFALGRAAAGMTDEAVRILLKMPGRPAHVQVYDRRTAAAILFASGRDSAASALLEGVPAFDRTEALDAVLAVLHEPIPGLNLDDDAMRAFGLSPTDLSANRDLMHSFSDLGFSAASLRFAKRVLSLAPGDVDAKGVLAKWESRGYAARLTVPLEHD